MAGSCHAGISSASARTEHPRSSPRSQNMHSTEIAESFHRSTAAAVVQKDERVILARTCRACHQALSPSGLTATT